MNTMIPIEQQANETILNYPGFQTLPKGVKRMLLSTEMYFFDQPLALSQRQSSAISEVKTRRRFTDVLAGKWMEAGIVLPA